MKILFFIDDLGSGGAQRQIVNLACLCKKAGHEVRLLRYGNQDFFLQRLKDEEIEVETILSKNYLERIIKVRSYIRRGWQDILISFLETPNFLANFSSIGRSNWKTITSERNAIKSSFQGFKGKVYKWFERYSDAVVCNSFNAKKMWMQYYPQYSEKLYVIHNCVEIPPSILNNDYTFRKNNRTNVIVVASYQKSKNPQGLIEALHLLADEEKRKIHIEWYGEKNVYDGGTRVFDAATEKIQNYGLSKTISLNGATKDILNRIWSADVLGLFSMYEGFPNAVCEGMALSKSIIMSRVSDYDILVDDTNGVLCNWDNPESIAEGLRRIINLSEEKLFLMGAASGEKAEKLFNPAVFYSNWARLLTDVLEPCKKNVV